MHLGGEQHFVHSATVPSQLLYKDFFPSVDLQILFLQGVAAFSRDDWETSLNSSSVAKPKEDAATLGTAITDSLRQGCRSPSQRLLGTSISERLP